MNNTIVCFQSNILVKYYCKKDFDFPDNGFKFIEGWYFTYDLNLYPKPSGLIQNEVVFLDGCPFSDLTHKLSDYFYTVEELRDNKINEILNEILL